VSSAITITTNKAISVSPPERKLRSRTPSITPKPTPDASAIGMLVMRAMIAPASPRISSVGPNEAPARRPPGMVGAIRIAVNADNAPPIAQARVDIRDA
jgi:hypothetical protein